MPSVLDADLISNTQAPAPSPCSRDGETPIVPVIVGDADAAVSASERALERGVFAQAIRPPTVPDGSSRMRLTVMASHTKAELRDAAKVVAKAVPEAARKAAARRALDAEAAAAGGRVFDRLADAA